MRPIRNANKQNSQSTFQNATNIDTSPDATPQNIRQQTGNSVKRKRRKRERVRVGIITIPRWFFNGPQAEYIKARHTNADEILVIWFEILGLVLSSGKNGELQFGKIISEFGSVHNTIATIIHRDEGIVFDALHEFCFLNMIEILKDGTLRVLVWEDFVYVEDEQRIIRSKQKEHDLLIQAKK